MCCHAARGKPVSNMAKGGRLQPAALLEGRATAPSPIVYSRAPRNPAENRPRVPAPILLLVIHIDQAREAYGVVLDEQTLQLDEEETKWLREV